MVRGGQNNNEAITSWTHTILSVTRWLEVEVIQKDVVILRSYSEVIQKDIVILKSYWEVIQKDFFILSSYSDVSQKDFVILRS